MKTSSSTEKVARTAVMSQRGMTLLEIMIVLAIIALVMGFLVGPKVLSSFQDAEVKTAQAIAKQFSYEAYARWTADHRGKGCPASIDELLKYTNRKDAKDPWGNDYVMLCGENAPAAAKSGFGVTSKGPDQKKGTEDDIHSWDD